MSDFTIGSETINVRYEVDEREIYNDIRSKIGLFISETVADGFYKWQVWTRATYVSPGATIRLTFAAFHLEPLAWVLESHTAQSRISPYSAYYAYSIRLEEITNQPRMRYVVITNTGSDLAYFVVVVKYKYATDSAFITHEEGTPPLLTVRATDETSIKKYGRRVMNLTWAEGSGVINMQSLVDYYLVRYKEPVARLKATIMGKTDTLRTQIITREISDVITADFNDLGFNADCYINSISIKDTPAGIPLCTWGLEEQRTEEALSIFTLGTNALDGAAVLGS